MLQKPQVNSSPRSKRTVYFHANTSLKILKQIRINEIEDRKRHVRNLPIIKQIHTQLTEQCPIKGFKTFKNLYREPINCFRRHSEYEYLTAKQKTFGIQYPQTFIQQHLYERKLILPVSQRYNIKIQKANSIIKSARSFKKETTMINILSPALRSSNFQLSPMFSSNRSNSEKQTDVSIITEINVQASPKGSSQNIDQYRRSGFVMDLRKHSQDIKKYSQIQSQKHIEQILKIAEATRVQRTLHRNHVQMQPRMTKLNELLNLQFAKNAQKLNFNQSKVENSTKTSARSKQSYYMSPRANIKYSYT